MIISADILGPLAGAGLGVAAIALLLAVAALRRARALESRYRLMMTGADGSAIGDALEAHLRRLAQAEGRLVALEASAADLDRRLRKAVQRVAVLRYKAFEDAGGDQSFAVALLDGARDGVVLSGLHGRGGIRVYAKPIAGGRSPYALTTEETSAIEHADAASLSPPAGS